MRPYNGYNEDYDDTDEFAFRRSQAFQKLLDDHRRENCFRHENRRRDYNKDRMHLDDSDWGDLFDDDSYGQY